jgi:hypothetical protein
LAIHAEFTYKVRQPVKRDDGFLAGFTEYSERRTGSNTALGEFGNVETDVL